MLTLKVQGCHFYNTFEYCFDSTNKFDKSIYGIMPLRSPVRDFNDDARSFREIQIALMMLRFNHTIVLKLRCVNHVKK